MDIRYDLGDLAGVHPYALFMHTKTTTENETRGHYRAEGLASKIPDFSNKITSIGTDPLICLLSRVEEITHQSTYHTSEQENMKAVKSQAALKS